MIDRGYVQCNGVHFYFNKDRTDYTSKMFGFRKW